MDTMVSTFDKVNAIASDVERLELVNKANEALIDFHDRGSAPTTWTST